MDISLSKKLKNISVFALDMIFPRHCFGCNIEQTWLCPDCEKSLQIIQTNSCFLCRRLTPNGICQSCRHKIPINGCFSVGFYRDPILKKMIHEFKYGYVADLKHPLNKLLVDILPQIPIKNEESLIVPVPLHPKRENERGFNQSSLLAEIISQKTNIQTLPLLKRIKPTDPQANLKPAKRPQNVANAFVINTSVKTNAKNIILLDDVITTGATIGECARILHQAGYKKIYVLTIARG